ncbi:DUF1428 domain-containing protein [Oceaniglobus roseus]|uniref:DUF1428 domain-containing protein n=1 Tax=Oceaniglobus roseus TaxID=1737570 RepID=UPI000C7F51A2|nr:DUF1428 domain-containing protein [Kandeliimicrobium roseum]
MAYVSGFVLAVPEARKAEYARHAEEMWPLFRDNGAQEMWENWEADVPEGKLTSFPLAVKREPGEAVVFSWILWPDRETSDRAWEAIMKDERMSTASEPPFDGKRMIWGSFETLVHVKEK